MAKHQSFSVESDEAALADLHRRLRETRWPGEPREADWRYGTNLGYLKRLVDYWLHDYDWAMAIDRINGFQQFIADASLGSDTLDLHFIREPGSGSGRLPLLLLHGWPGSIAEFLDFIPPLAYPDRFGGEADDGFEVIAPSLPGFAFSEAPPAPSGPRAVARLLLRFMTETLGHERFYIQGGDWGAIIGTQMADFL